MGFKFHYTERLVKSARYAIRSMTADMTCKNTSNMRTNQTKRRANVVSVRETFPMNTNSIVTYKANIRQRNSNVSIVS